MASISNNNSEFNTSLGDAGGGQGGAGKGTGTGSALGQLAQIYSNNNNNTASSKREHSPTSDDLYASDTSSVSSEDREWVRRVRGSKRSRREAMEMAANPNWVHPSLRTAQQPRQQSDGQGETAPVHFQQQQDNTVASNNNAAAQSRVSTADRSGIRYLIEIVDSEDDPEDESEHDSYGSAPMDFSEDDMPGSDSEYDDGAGGADNSATENGGSFNSQNNNNDEAYDADDQSGDPDDNQAETNHLPPSDNNREEPENSRTSRSATPPPPPHRTLATPTRAHFDIYASDSDLSSLGSSPSPPPSPTFARLERERLAPPPCTCTGWCTCQRYKTFTSSLYPGDGVLTAEEADKAGVELPSQVHLSNRVLDAEAVAESGMRETLNGRPGPQGRVDQGEVKGVWSWDLRGRTERAPQGWVGGVWKGVEGVGGTAVGGFDALEAVEGVVQSIER